MMQLKNLAQVAKRNVQATTNPLSLHQVCYTIMKHLEIFILYIQLHDIACMHTQMDPCYTETYYDIVFIR